MSADLSPKRSSQFNFNSVLMLGGLALMVWQLETTLSLRATVGDIVAVQPFRNDSATRMEKKQDDFSRELGQLREEIQKLQLRMAGWDSGSSPRTRSPKDQ